MTGFQYISSYNKEILNLLLIELNESSQNL